jgi:hypothetical protein
MSFSSVSGFGKLSLAGLIEKLRSVFQSFADPRTGKNGRYAIEDAALSAFSVFFMQSPSFLDYQRTMRQAGGGSNVQSLFGVHEIPTDNQIRSLLDETAPSVLWPMFAYVVDGLQAAGVLDRYRSLDQTLLLALDGTQYFSSPTLHCAQCSVTRHAKGHTTYSHTAVTPVLVKPGLEKVIALAPEFVTPQDGSVKQDCELAAGKRWLDEWGTHYSPWGVTLLGDDLYCHEPFCRQALALGFDFLFVCKPNSHATLYAWRDDLDRLGAVHTLVQQRRSGKICVTDTYRFAQSLPLREADEALQVNWCELTRSTKDGRVLYHNAFATSHPIHADNVADLVAAGRARWKIENENNNTLKTKGYHFEHNYGHGKKHLACLLATLIILAYLLHTILEWFDHKYSLLRQKLASRQRFFNDLRAVTCYLRFDSWDAVLEFMLQGLERPFVLSRPPGHSP